MEKENTMDEYHCHKRQLTFSPIQQSTTGEPALFTLVNVVVVFKGELISYLSPSHLLLVVRHLFDVIAPLRSL